jgi:hypothetical protein
MIPRKCANKDIYFPSPRLRRLACLAITLLFMANTLHHMFEGIRPFDWLMLVIEVLVLIVIIFAEIAGWMRRRKESRRHSFLNAKSLELSKMMDTGQRLMSIVPDPAFASPQAFMFWVQTAADWTDQVSKIMSPHSSRAVADFMLATNSQHIDAMVSAHGRNFALSGEIWETYWRLVTRLENLRRIVERPETYF